MSYTPTIYGNPYPLSGVYANNLSPYYRGYYPTSYWSNTYGSWNYPYRFRYPASFPRRRRYYPRLPGEKQCPTGIVQPICTQQWDPVCGIDRDGYNRRRQTYSNPCAACADPDIDSYTPGPCRGRMYV